MLDLVEWRQAVRLCRFDYAIEDSTGLGTVAGIGEHPIPSPDHEGFNRTLGAVVIDTQAAIIEITNELGPLP